MKTAHTPLRASRPAVKATFLETPVQRRFAALLLGALLMAFAYLAQAATVSELLRKPVKDRQGEALGVVQDLVLDVRAGRVLYVIVDAKERFHTLPIRALSADLRVDMSAAGTMAQRNAEDDPRLARAARLIGQPLEHPSPGGKERIGVIRDIEFDAVSGTVEKVIVATEQGRRDFPAGVLAQGRFPPLSGGKPEYVDQEALGERGYVRGHASDERQRTHEHRFPR